jgi:hypothetical protein
MVIRIMIHASNYCPVVPSVGYDEPPLSTRPLIKIPYSSPMGEGKPVQDNASRNSLSGLSFFSSLDSCVENQESPVYMTVHLPLSAGTLGF